MKTIILRSLIQYLHLNMAIIAPIKAQSIMSYVFHCLSCVFFLLHLLLYQLFSPVGISSLHSIICWNISGTDLQDKLQDFVMSTKIIHPQYPLCSTLMLEQIPWRCSALCSVTHLGEVLRDIYKNQLTFSSRKPILPTDFFLKCALKPPMTGNKILQKEDKMFNALRGKNNI